MAAGLGGLMSAPFATIVQDLPGHESSRLHYPLPALVWRGGLCVFKSCAGPAGRTYSVIGLLLHLVRFIGSGWFADRVIHVLTQTGFQTDCNGVASSLAGSGG